MTQTPGSHEGSSAADGLFSSELKALLQDTVHVLSGSERRMFMARTARLFGPNGHRRAERELGWNRKTLRKGEYELQHGPIADRFSARGRKPAEHHLPHLLQDIQAIVTPESEVDPTFQTPRRYRRITGDNVRKRLIEAYGYRDEELPTVQTIRTKLNQLDYRPRKVVKSKPKKSFRKPMRSSSDSTS